MNEISIGAVGAAVIAGLVSLLGLIIGKEQKVSEFRQAWINDLRICMISYLSEINAICDLVRIEASGRPISQEKLVESYKALNEANHGILLRVNREEEHPKALLAAMEAFENAAASKATLTPQIIKDSERDFLAASEKLLKHEWNVVKRGEKTYFWSKWITIIVTIALILLLGNAWRLSWARAEVDAASLAEDDRPTISSTVNFLLTEPAPEGEKGAVPVQEHVQVP